MLCRQRTTTGAQIVQSDASKVLAESNQGPEGSIRVMMLPDTAAHFPQYPLPTLAADPGHTALQLCRDALLSHMFLRFLMRNPKTLEHTLKGAKGRVLPACACRTLMAVGTMLLLCLEHPLRSVNFCRLCLIYIQGL